MAASTKPDRPMRPTPYAALRRWHSSQLSLYFWRLSPSWGFTWWHKPLQLKQFSPPRAHVHLETTPQHTDTHSPHAHTHHDTHTRVRTYIPPNPPVVLISERILQGQFVGMRMGLGIRRLRKQGWKKKKGKQKSVSRISLLSCLTDPNEGQMKREASGRAAEGPSRLALPCITVNLLVVPSSRHKSAASYFDTRHGTKIKFKVD